MGDEHIIPPFSGKLKVDQDLRLTFPNKETTLNLADADKYLENAITTQVKTYDHTSVAIYPHLHVFALFASNAYKDTEDNMLPLPDGWKLIVTATNTSKNNGYFGAAFMHPERRQIVIAHRGSKFKSWSVFGYIHTNIQSVMFEKTTSQMESACTFSHKVCSIAMKIGIQDGIRFQIFFTGHSLGGWLAQITTFCVRYLAINDSNFQKAEKSSDSIHAHTVVFESPGCKGMLSKMKAEFDARNKFERAITIKALDITTFLSAPNEVNMCNLHAGTLYRIDINFSHLGVKGLKTHKMKYIVAALDPKKIPTTEIQLVVDWPTTNVWNRITRPIRKLSKYTRDESINFFRCAPHEHNYTPNKESDEYKAMIDRHGSYCPIRYQTISDGMRFCNMNVFTETEQHFLKTYCNKRMTCGSNNLDREIFDRIMPCKHDMLEKIRIGSNFIACEQSETVTTLIQYVQQLLHSNPHILDGLEGKIFNHLMRKKFYLNEHQRFLDSLKIITPFLDSRHNPGFGDTHQVTQVAVKRTEEMRTTTAKIYSHCANGGTEKTDCMVLKLKQLLFIDKQRQVSLKSFLESKEMTELLLIIECQQRNRLYPSWLYDEAIPLLRDIVSVLEKNKNIRLIFITEKSGELSNFLQEECQTKLGNAFQKIIDKGIVWEDLATTSQDEILRKNLVYFNEGDKTSLADLVDKSIDFSKVLDCEALNMLIQGEDIFVGKEPQSLFELKAQFADLREVISQDCLVQALRNSDSTTHFFISCSINEKEKLLERLKILQDRNELMSIIHFAVEQDPYVIQWKGLCCQYPRKTIYWVEITPQQIVLCKHIYNPDFYIERQFTPDYKRIIEKSNAVFLMSYDANHEKDTALNIKRDLKKGLVVVLPEKKAEIYFPHFVRYFKDVNWLKVHEKQHLRLEKSENNNILSVSNEESLTKLQYPVVIVGEPGIGKSNTLMHLAGQLKSHWVIFKDLVDCKRALEKLQSVSTIAEDHAVAFLSEEDKHGLCSALAKALLKCGLQGKTKRKMHLLFDGFDVLDENERETFVELILFMKISCKCRIWITTRKHCRQHIVDKLSATAIDLIAIEDSEQKKLLTIFWQAHLSLKMDEDRKNYMKIPEYAGKVLQIASEMQGKEKQSLLSNPLVLRMIAESVVPKFKHLANFAPENLSIDVSHIAPLYRKFIKKKCDIYFEEKAKLLSSSSDAPKRWCNAFLMKKHSILAYRMMFPNNAKLHIGNYTAEDCKYDVNDLQPVGLIQFDDDKEYTFIHLSFAEYFVAELHVNLLFKPEDQYRPIEQFLMSPILREHSGKEVRSLVNGMVAKKPKINDLIISSTPDITTILSPNQVQYLVDSCSSALHLAAEENLCNVTEILLTCFKIFPEVLQVNIILSQNCHSNTALFIAMEKNHFDTVKRMLENVIGSAAIWQELLWSTFLTDGEPKKRLIIDNTLKMIECSTDMKHIFEQIIHKKKCIVDFLDAARKDNITDMAKLLHQGVKKDGRLFRKYILSSTNAGKKTALHIAAENGKLMSVKWLLDAGANINARDQHGSTPLRLALEKNRKETVYFLQEKKAEVGETDKFGQTALEPVKDNQAKGEKPLKTDGVTIEKLDVIEYLHSSLKSKKVQEDFEKLSAECKNDLIIFIDRNNETSLHIAAKIGHLEMVIWLLDKGANVNANDNKGSTPLHMAAMKGHLEIVSWLLDKGADVNANGEKGSTPLHVAYMEGHLEMVIWLLDKGANVNANDNKGSTPLHMAAMKGHLEIVSRLLGKDANVNANDEKGSTPLHMAAMNGHLEVVIWLLGKDANVNANDQRRSTPLHMAVKKGHIKVVEHLLDKGAAVNAHDRYGHTALDLTKNTELRELLTGRGADESPEQKLESNILYFLKSYKTTEDITQLDDKISEKDVEEFKKQIINFADINKKTSLHLAAMEGRLELMSWLLNEGATVNAVDKKRSTPLHVAAKEGHLEAVSLLLNNGAAVNANDKKRATPLHMAAEKGHLEVVKCLLDKVANVNANDQWGSTPLHLAAINGHLEVVSWLLDKVADVDANDQSGSTPLHMAAKGSRVKVVEALLKKCADINAQDKSGQTAYTLAKSKTLQKLLLSNGAVENPIPVLVDRVHTPMVPESNNDKDDDLLALVAEAGQWQLVKRMIKLGAGINKLTASDKTNLLNYFIGKGDEPKERERTQSPNERTTPKVPDEPKKLEADKQNGSKKHTFPRAIRMIIALNNVQFLDIMINELRQHEEIKSKCPEQCYTISTVKHLSKDMDQRLQMQPFYLNAAKELCIRF